MFHSLQVVDWCVEYDKSFEELEADKAAYTNAYPHQVHVQIPAKRYREALEWLHEKFGPEDPDSLNDYNFGSRWCRFHPMTSKLAMEEGDFTSSIFGFQTASDAVLFKLSWWH